MSLPITGQCPLTDPNTSARVSLSPVNVSAWVLKAPVTNLAPAWIGAPGVTSSTGHQLDPGETMEYERSTQNTGNKYEVTPYDVAACGSSGDKLTWFGSPA